MAWPEKCHRGTNSPRFTYEDLFLKRKTMFVLRLDWFEKVIAKTKLKDFQELIMQPYYCLHTRSSSSYDAALITVSGCFIKLLGLLYGKIQVFSHIKAIKRNTIICSMYTPYDYSLSFQIQTEHFKLWNLILIYSKFLNGYLNYR